MKILTLLAALAAAASVQAQGDDARFKTKALSFGFNGSGVIGGKAWISDQSALTLSLGGTTNSSRVEAADTSSLDDEYTQFSLSVTVGLERHFDLGLGFSPYVTGGVSAGYGRSVSRSGTTTYSYEFKSNSTDLGLRAGVGVEYWLVPRVSLAGQQLLSAGYSFGSRTNGSAGALRQDTGAFSMGLGTSSLILSVYF